MHTLDTQPGRLTPIDPEECWDLVRSRPVGRLAWSGERGVAVVPVNFSVAPNAPVVIIRTTPYSLLARDCVDRRVSFEVDLLDEERHAGWSVLLQGYCHRQERTTGGPTPWVTGPRLLGLSIDVDTVTGRRVDPPAEPGHATERQ